MEIYSVSAMPHLLRGPAPKPVTSSAVIPPEVTSPEQTADHPHGQQSASLAPPLPQRAETEKPGGESPAEASAEEEPQEQQAQTPGERILSELSPQEQREVEQLRVRDQAVRAHEMAHVVAGGQYVTKPASYEYRVGPDGRRYAVGGEVSINVSPVPNDPQATITKAQAIRRAALAPVDPSPQDYQVAAKAGAMELQARRELAEENLQKQREKAQSGNTDFNLHTIFHETKVRTFGAQKLQLSLLERIQAMFPSPNIPGSHITVMA
ncbi:putative metalloprotease CJM1_0395 family protein [Thiorhodospira sibirica]|uniref:putative metalloprotease CJM1_0395 family protein n=1 Tax=Thiorhodospira sibirica TaxID=154347 RepID=UPI00022C39B8|nr:putative metalloprotease CJM1_0395 family protein [Thiorhodospira sibirica]